MALEKVKEFVKAMRKPRPLTLEQYAEKLIRKGLNPDGTPVVDPRPLAPPVGYKKAPSMVEIVRDMVRSERLAQEAADADLETFEESEDFDIEDEPGYARSPWENDHDPSVSEARYELDQEKLGRELRRRERMEYFEDRDAYRARKGGDGGAPPSPGPAQPGAAEPPIAKPDEP